MRIGRTIIIPAILALGMAGSVLSNSVTPIPARRPPCAHIRGTTSLWVSTLVAIGPRSLLVLAFLVVLAVLAVLVMVVSPAVWSRKKQRRDAALAVLKSILGREVSGLETRARGKSLRGGR